MKFQILVTLKIAALIVVTTALYTYIGQLVPQKMVLPPQETVMRADMTTDELVQIGLELIDGKGLCRTCHTFEGKKGALRFPDLAGIAATAETRIAGMGGLEYLARSIYEPNEFIVEGFSPGMPVINKPPIGLNDQEIVAVIAYLQSLGGTPTVTLDTTLGDMGLE
ncbi:MAG: cytochrome c [bacterium]|nr:cytochrome c [bacterium]